MNRRIPLIAGGVVVVLLLVWYVALWRPAGTASTRAVASEAAAGVLHQQLENDLTGLLTLQRTLPADEAKLRQGEIGVPASASVDTVIDQINAIAIADQIVWTNESQTLGGASAVAVAPTTSTSDTTSTTSSATTVPAAVAPASGTGDTPLALTLAVTGSYPAMTKFITQLEHLPRLLVIDTLNYSPAGTVVSVNMTARAFYNANATVPAAAGAR